MRQPTCVRWPSSLCLFLASYNKPLWYTNSQDGGQDGAVLSGHLQRRGTFLRRRRHRGQLQQRAVLAGVHGVAARDRASGGTCSHKQRRCDPVLLQGALPVLPSPSERTLAVATPPPADSLPARTLAFLPQARAGPHRHP